MNPAIFRKALRDSGWLVLLVPIALVVFEVLVVRALSESGSESAGYWLHRPFTKRLLKMLLGSELGDITPTTLVTIGLAHPLLYALNWTLLLSVATRMTAGEIDRGTADLLLTLPVSRLTVYVSCSALWILAGIPASVAPLLGVYIGEWWAPLWEPVTFGPLWLLALNLLAMYLAVGGLTMLVSSAVSRRGSAIAVVLAGLLGSFLLNFLAAIWPAAERIAFLGLLHYYHPLPCIREGLVPVRDLVVLGSVGVVAWLVGALTYCRRDIPAA